MQRINCDVFMTDGSILSLEESICITGNFYAGDNCSLFADIDTEGEVILGDNSYVESISAKDNVSIGDFSEAISICSDKNVTLGNHSSATEVFATKDVILGYHANSCSITAGGDILKGKRFNLLTLFKRFCLELKL